MIGEVVALLGLVLVVFLVATADPLRNRFWAVSGGLGALLVLFGTVLPT